ncbi:DUF6349 family protein [Streptomyces xiamenensis]
MTATAAGPAGARARQTFYWRVRNARTRALAKQSPASTWHIQPGHPGGAYSDLGHDLDPPAHCAPTLLSRTKASAGRDAQEFRGGCLACDWEGPVHRGGGHGDGDNEAVEDAHDHAFPGWRSLPTTIRATDGWQTPYQRGRWNWLRSLYPEGWMDRGAPLLAWGRHRREAHRPPHRRCPRYELRLTRPPNHQDEQLADQGKLF